MAQLGLRTEDLDDLTEGDVYDMIAESANDQEKWELAPTNETADGTLV